MSAPVQDALRRAAVYRVLAGAFAYPAPERLEEIRHTAAMAAGIEPSPAVAGALRVMARAAGDVEDHIGVELDFMAALALKEAWARAADVGEGLDIVRTAERTFLDDHLARWADAFAERLLQAPAPDFYGAAARLLAVWLRDECARLGVVPGRSAALGPRTTAPPSRARWRPAGYGKGSSGRRG